MKIQFFNSIFILIKIMGMRVNKLGLSCAKHKSSLASKATQPKGYVKLYRLKEYDLLLLENYYSGWGGWVGEWRNKTKLQPSSVWLELELSLAKANIEY